MADQAVVLRSVAHTGEGEYSVTFDEPQLDASSDTSYGKAVIWDRYLEPL